MFRFFIFALVIILASTANADVLLKPKLKSFYYHRQYGGNPPVKFLPAEQDMEFRVWNCKDGTMPIPGTVTGLDTVMCMLETGQYDRFGNFVPDYAPARVVYQTNLPAGSCIDRGSSCRYRDDGTARQTKNGIASLRVLYARSGHGNKIWLQSYGDLSAATEANMHIEVIIGGKISSRSSTFNPRPNGGWHSD